jgi:TRAP-type C4-dicarboxylate transport system permease small subunit
MQDRMIGIARGLRVVAKWALWISAAGLVAMTAVVAWQVFSRYALNQSPSWSEATAVLLMGWFIFLGAAVGIREGYHLSFDVLLYVMPEGGKRFLHTVSDLVVTLFACGMVVYGAMLAYGTWDATLPTVGLPGGFAFLALVAGGMLMVLFSVERIFRRLAGLETARFGETDLPEE